MTDIDEEFRQGYMDAGDPDCPIPNDNRHPAYVHSFKVRRAEMNGNPIPVQLSRKRAEKIEMESIL